MNKKQLNTLERRLWCELKKAKRSTPEYDKIMKDIVTVSKLQRENNLLQNPQVLSALGYIAGIFAILTFERTNIITTKAFSFIPRITQSTMK